MTALVVARTTYVEDNGDARKPDARDAAVVPNENATDLNQHTRPLEQIHGSGLHLWGVVEGLGVTATTGSAGLTVSPGIALDADGRHISLADKGRAKLPTGLGDVKPDGVKVPTAHATGVRYLTIAWEQTRLATSYTMEHTPLVELVDQPNLDSAPRGYHRPARRAGRYTQASAGVPLQTGPGPTSGRMPSTTAARPELKDTT